jgi:hypothetical protein
LSLCGIRCYNLQNIQNTGRRAPPHTAWLILRKDFGCDHRFNLTRVGPKGDNQCDARRGVGLGLQVVAGKPDERNELWYKVATDTSAGCNSAPRIARNEKMRKIWRAGLALMFAAVVLIPTTSTVGSSLPEPAGATTIATQTRQQAVALPAVPVTPTTSGLINSICDVPLLIVGSGFYPNVNTLICQSFSSESAVDPFRAGKTITTAVTLACDTDGDGVTDIALQTVSVPSGNLVQGTLASLGPQLPGTAFPTTCCGGMATLTVSQTFTTGDNNVFGLTTLTTSCTLDLGVRAPVVISATPSDGDCTNSDQDLLISGFCFVVPEGSVTSVMAVELLPDGSLNPANTIVASKFQILNSGLIDAFFKFGSESAGKTFLIFVVGPGGTSRNLTSPPTGTINCPPGYKGNEQGVQVSFRCNSPGAGGPAPPPDVIASCEIGRTAGGAFTLIVIGTNFQEGLTVTVGGKTPKRVKLRELDVASNTFRKLILKGNICGGLPGNIVVVNPNGIIHSPFLCPASCPTQ